MCGIAGVFGPRQPGQAELNRALGLMSRRGPDASGIWQGQIGSSALTLLHSRLSIVDLDPRSNQPFVREDIVVAYNGEIYNYVERREVLLAAGVPFATSSDTEVLTAAWQRKGEAALDEMEGMWAFALADVKKGHLVLCRDRFGEKPLVWTFREGTLYFASEIKVLAVLVGDAFSVDGNQIRRFLVNGYKALHKQRSTYFRDVEELPAASIVVLERPAPLSPRRYWSLATSPESMSEQAALEGVRHYLDRAVELRLRADVPVAFCLSGGIDSGAIASIAVKRLGRRITCFSIVDKDPRYDESRNIDAVVRSLDCDHHVIRPDAADFLDRLEVLVGYHDAPVATISYYLHAFLSRSIAEAGFKVALSGTGADELFTGYYDHYAFWLAEMADLPNFDTLLADWRGGYGTFVRNKFLQDPEIFVKSPRERRHIYLDRDVFNGLMREPLDENFFEEEYAAGMLRSRMLNELNHEVVPVILAEDDRNSMMHSVENRSPFLDRQLAEFLFRVPTAHLIKDGFVKYLLRQAVAGVLPDQVRLDKRKVGFNGSLDTLLNRSDRDVRDRLLSDSPIFDYVDRDRFRKFFDGDISDNSYSKFMFSFISSKLFLESDLARGRMPSLTEFR